MSPGVSYKYDAIGRITEQRDSRSLTIKTYTPRTERITNALGFVTIGERDAYGNLVKFIEKLPNKDSTTTYTYDAVRHPIRLTDTL